MISLTVLFLILIGHFVADFVCQNDWMALNKSKSNYALFVHCAAYSAVMILVGMFFIQGTQIFEWVGVNFALHFAVDYITSRVNYKLWMNEQRHWFFVCIGFDQLLHYASLFVTYYMLVSSSNN